MRILFATLALALAVTPVLAEDEAVVTEYPRYRFDTSEGSFVVELDGRRAPLTVANFARLAEAKFYNGTVFHRVILGFVAQAGGYNEKLEASLPGYLRFRHRFHPGRDNSGGHR